MQKAITPRLLGAIQLKCTAAVEGGGGLFIDALSIARGGQNGGDSGTLLTMELNKDTVYQTAIGQGGLYGDEATESNGAIYAGHGYNGGQTVFGEYSIAGGYGGFGGASFGYDPIKYSYSGKGVGDLASNGSTTEITGYGNKNNAT